MSMEMAAQARPLEIVVAADSGKWLVEVCLLGSFRLRLWRSASSPRVGVKTEALLASLALAGDGGVAREVLLEQVWPEIDAQLARQSLNSLVHAVRRLLGGQLGGAAPVLNLGGLYRLNFEAGMAVDVLRFDALADAGDRTLRSGDEALAARMYSRAVDIYRGDLSCVADVRGVVERERLRSRYMHLLATLADYYFTRDEPITSLTHALKLLRADPCREDAHRLAMRCFVRMGQRAQALRQYRLCEEVMRREFDTAPEPATSMLFEQALRDPRSV